MRTNKETARNHLAEASPLRHSRAAEPPGGAIPSRRWLLVVGAAMLLVGCDCSGSSPALATPDDAGTESSHFQAERRRMVRDQMAARDIADPRVLAAMREVPRHQFVPTGIRSQAYTDHPLPIGHDQTISQPYVVAFMTQALELEGDEKVLEIGTGSGYQAAVLAELCRQVYTIEIVDELAARAEQTLDQLGYDNVHVRAGDGYQGWPDQAPFDAIIVTAAPPEVPEPLVEQLATGGRMVIPVGERLQNLQVLIKTEDGIEQQQVMPVRFVPMTGQAQQEGS